jgi:hypothetical protein
LTTEIHLTITVAGYRYRVDGGRIVGEVERNDDTPANP